MHRSVPKELEMARPNQAQTRRMGSARNVSPASGERATKRTVTQEKVARQNAPTTRPPSQPVAAIEDDEREEDRPTPIYPRFALATRVTLADDEDEGTSPGRYLAQNVAEESLGAPTPPQGKRARAAKGVSASREATALRGGRPDARVEASEVPSKRGK